MDPHKYAAKERAALYLERWETETACDEVKTHLRGNQTLLRSQRPDLVLQEACGLLITHFALRDFTHDAALHDGCDPDHLSFMHAVRLVRRTLSSFAALSPLTTSPSSDTLSSKSFYSYASSPAEGVETPEASSTR